MIDGNKYDVNCSIFHTVDGNNYASKNRYNYGKDRRVLWEALANFVHQPCFWWSWDERPQDGTSIPFIFLMVLCTCIFLQVWSGDERQQVLNCGLWEKCIMWLVVGSTSFNRSLLDKCLKHWSWRLTELQKERFWGFWGLWFLSMVRQVLNGL